jgi:hypothetical protein
MQVLIKFDLLYVFDDVLDVLMLYLKGKVQFINGNDDKRLMDLVVFGQKNSPNKTQGAQNKRGSRGTHSFNHSFIYVTQSLVHSFIH